MEGVGPRQQGLGGNTADVHACPAHRAALDHGNPGAEGGGSDGGGEGGAPGSDDGQVIVVRSDGGRGAHWSGSLAGHFSRADLAGGVTGGSKGSRHLRWVPVEVGGCLTAAEVGPGVSGTRRLQRCHHGGLAMLAGHSLDVDNQSRHQMFSSLAVGSMRRQQAISASLCSRNSLPDPAGSGPRGSRCRRGCACPPPGPPRSRTTPGMPGARTPGPGRPRGGGRSRPGATRPPREATRRCAGGWRRQVRGRAGKEARCRRGWWAQAQRWRDDQQA